MATPRIDRVTEFTIGKDAYDWAVYVDRHDHPPDVKVEEIIKMRRSRGVGATESGPHPSRGRPERYLDINERKKKGACLYLFSLDEIDDDRLCFMEKAPFIPLPLNSEGDPDTFLTNVTIHDEQRLWASFVCDLDAARDSNVAKQIGRLGQDHPEHDHPGILNIPFTFNVLDPLFRAAPWVVPGHSDPHMDHGHIRTHGGVHPTTVAFLSLQL